MVRKTLDKIEEIVHGIEDREDAVRKHLWEIQRLAQRKGSYKAIWEEAKKALKLL